LFADTSSAAKTLGFRHRGKQTQAGQSNRQQHQKSFHVFLIGWIKQSGSKYNTGNCTHGCGGKSGNAMGKYC
jgi:hypothetical protein